MKYYHDFQKARSYTYLGAELGVISALILFNAHGNYAVALFVPLGAYLGFMTGSCFLMALGAKW